MRLTGANPMGRVLMALLAFEAVVFGLAIPGMIVVSGQPVEVATLVGGAAIVLALAAAATLRRPIGFGLAWATQVVAVGMGLLAPAMFFMGGVFVALFVTAFVLGKRLDASR